MRYGKRLWRSELEKTTHFADKNQLKISKNGSVYIVHEGQRGVKVGEKEIRPLIKVQMRENEVSWYLVGEAQKADPRDIWDALKLFIDRVDKCGLDEEEGFDYEPPKGMKTWSDQEGGIYVGIDVNDKELYGFYSIGVKGDNSFYSSEQNKYGNPSMLLNALRSLLYPLETACGWTK